jgi:alpha-glucosidase (family GH31 glycosyl hydrolase)
LIHSSKGGDIDNLSIDVTFETTDRLRFKITDKNSARYEVPIPVGSSPGPVDPATTSYSVSYTTAPFGLSVTRKSTDEVLLNTTRGGFIFADQFLQISTKLASKNLFGLGEHVSDFLLNSSYHLLPLFSRDQGTPIGYTNLYGVQPFYICVEDSGSAHGVFLLNSNAMDVVLQPTPAITYVTPHPTFIFGSSRNNFVAFLPLSSHVCCAHVIFLCDSEPLGASLIFMCFWDPPRRLWSSSMLR